MRIVFIFMIFSYSLMAENLIFKPDGKYKILSNLHLVNDIEYKKDNNYQALIEIPAGVREKWEVNHKSGHLEWEFQDKKPRKVKFLGYPGNYGFIPQTILEKKDGGDGDPLDIIVLDASVKKGTIQKIRVLGAIKLLDSGEQDDKIIAISINGAFSKINTLSQMMIEFPGSIEIIRYWFEGYKGNKMQFMGYMKRDKAESLVEKAHKSWSNHQNVH